MSSSNRFGALLEEPEPSAQSRASGAASTASEGNAARPKREGKRIVKVAPRRGRQFDRHSGTGIADSEKKTNQGWGHSVEAEASGEKDAAAEAGNDQGEGAGAAEAEEITMTLEEFKAKQKSSSLPVTEFEASRRANEDKSASNSSQSASNPTESLLGIQSYGRGNERGRGRGGFERGRGGSERGRGRGGNNTRGKKPRAVNITDANQFPKLG